MGNKNSGPRPKPTALRILRGVTRKDRLNPAEPQPPAGHVDKPAGLSPGADRAWDALAPVCLAMGTLTVADVKVFARMCELEATWDAVVALKGTEGFSPRQELDTARELRPYSALFGLEPVSRARIHVKKPEPVSKWADAL